MVTGMFMLDNPNPFAKQYGEVRRNGAKPSGVHVAHSTESVPDWVGPDTGAELVARWIATIRTSYGSYHEITDSDGFITMAPLLFETWHCVPTNNHSVGFSMATQADKWHLATPEWRNSVIGITAERVANSIKWHETDRGIIVPVRLITRAEALNRVPGITFHGITDPTRRSDPWVKHPNAGIYTDYFLSKIAEALGQGAALPDPEPVPVTPEPKPPIDYNTYGYSVNQIKGIQRFLQYAGFYKGNIDGDYGPMTYNAVKAYQSVQFYWPGKVVDGYWGDKTWAHSDWTRTLQETLNEWKGYDIRVDGDYGTVTRERVRYTQQRNGLYPDGIAGPKTCAKLQIRTHP